MISIPKPGKKFWIGATFILIVLAVLIIIITTRESLSIDKKINIIPRGPIDKRLSGISTKILGTKETPLYIINDFLSPQECKDIIDSVKGTFVPSPLTRQDPDDPNFRTSKTGYFTTKGIHQKLEDKMNNFLNIQHPNSTDESIQIQHYEPGNEFKPHWDWFDPSEDKEFYDKGQRTWTFTVYLNDVQKGGSTHFTKLNNSVYPKTGRAAIWCNLTKNGELDYDTQHQGSPVIEGEKYIITKWYKYIKNPTSES